MLPVASLPPLPARLSARYRVAVLVLASVVWGGASAATPAAGSTDWGLALIDLVQKLAPPSSTQNPAPRRSNVEKAMHPCALIRLGGEVAPGADKVTDAEGPCLLAGNPALRVQARIWGGPDETVRALALQLPMAIDDDWLQAGPRWRLDQLACLRGNARATGGYFELVLPGRKPVVVGVIHSVAADKPRGPGLVTVVVGFGRDIVPPEGSPATPALGSTWTRRCDVAPSPAIAVPASAAPVPAGTPARPEIAVQPSSDPALLEALLDRRLRTPPLDCDSGSYQVFSRSAGWQQFAAGKVQLPPLRPLVHYTPTTEGFWLHMLYPANEAIRSAVGEVAAGEYVFDVRVMPPDHVLIVRRGLALDRAALEKGELVYGAPTIERSVVRVCDRAPALPAAGTNAGALAPMPATSRGSEAAATASTSAAPRRPPIAQPRATQPAKAPLLADVMAALARPGSESGSASGQRPGQGPQRASSFPTFDRDLVTVSARLAGCTLQGDLDTGRAGQCLFKVGSGKGDTSLPFLVTLHGEGYRVTSVEFVPAGPLPAAWKIARRPWKTKLLACRGPVGNQERWLQVDEAAEPPFYARVLSGAAAGGGSGYRVIQYFDVDAVPPLGPGSGGDDWSSACLPDAPAAPGTPPALQTDPTMLLSVAPPPAVAAGNDVGANGTPQASRGAGSAGRGNGLPPPSSRAWIPGPLPGKRGG